MKYAGLAFKIYECICQVSFFKYQINSFCIKDMHLLQYLSRIFRLAQDRQLKNNTNFSQNVLKKAGISILDCIAKSHIQLNNIAKANMIISMVLLIFSKLGSVKGRLLIPELVTCYFRDAQCEQMKLSSEVTQTKVRNPEKVCKRLFSEEEDSGHVKYRYKIIGRLISIKVLWKFFPPNTLIKGEL